MVVLEVHLFGRLEWACADVTLLCMYRMNGNDNSTSACNTSAPPFFLCMCATPPPLPPPLPPPPETYGSLGSTARVLLEAVARSLDLRSHTFADLLDNVPLKASEVASSVLSLVCHGRRMHT